MVLEWWNEGGKNCEAVVYILLTAISPFRRYPTATSPCHPTHTRPPLTQLIAKVRTARACSSTGRVCDCHSQAFHPQTTILPICDKMQSPSYPGGGGEKSCRYSVRVIALCDHGMTCKSYASLVLSITKTMTMMMHFY